MFALYGYIGEAYESYFTMFETFDKYHLLEMVYRCQ